MSRNQFRLLVVVNQLLFFAAVVVQDVSDQTLPPELKNYLGIDHSVLNAQLSSVSRLSDTGYWIWTALLFAGAVAAVGLFYGKRWGRSLYLLTWLASVLLTLMSDVYVDTGWTASVSYLATTTEGMILALVYFSHVRRIFDDPQDE